MEKMELDSMKSATELEKYMSDNYGIAIEVIDFTQTRKELKFSCLQSMCTVMRTLNKPGFILIGKAWNDLYILKIINEDEIL